MTSKSADEQGKRANAKRNRQQPEPSLTVGCGQSRPGPDAARGAVAPKPRRGAVVTSRAEAVLTELRDRILAGEFPAGFHLQEIPLAEELEVSRTPIREALVTLAHEGLLAPGPKRGYEVRTFTIEEVVDAYEVRANLEGLAARLLCEGGLPAPTAVELERCLDVGDALLRKGLGSRDQLQWLEMNNTFHTVLVRATNNKMLEGFIQQTHRVPLASSRHVHWYSFDEENFEIARQAHRAHHDVYDAIMAGQSVRAEALMREHVYFSRRVLLRYVRERFVGFETRGPGPLAGVRRSPRKLVE
jgi:GntR family transcriptional regulator, vanillate catabolism transcriptional regulator